MKQEMKQEMKQKMKQEIHAALLRVLVVTAILAAFLPPVHTRGVAYAQETAPAAPTLASSPTLRLTEPASNTGSLLAASCWAWGSGCWPVGVGFEAGDEAGDACGVGDVCGAHASSTPLASRASIW